MTTRSLDVFSLRDTVVSEYKRFATSFTTIHADDIRGQVEAIYAEQRYWPEPLIQINPSYRRSTDVGRLASAGVLDPGCASIFQKDGQPLSLAHLDAAFDQGFITVTDDGQVAVSCVLDMAARECLGLTVARRMALAEGHRQYLAWHRERVFRKSGAGRQ